MDMRRFGTTLHDVYYAVKHSVYGRVMAKIERARVFPIMHIPFPPPKDVAYFITKDCIRDRIGSETYATVYR